MDPTTALEELLDAIDDMDFDAARERAEALREWLEKDGANPVWSQVLCRRMQSVCIKLGMEEI